ncbi:MAG: Calcium-binding EF-h [Proteobacteria bacterium]|nr:Calcium-binding EF-h [Pseudomonadota bacterium]
MSSTISSSYTMQRPDPAQMASKLFSKLDTKGQGYIEQSDLQSAFDQIASASSFDSSTSVSDVFKQLDSDSDGKVTEDELTDTLSKLADELDSQFNQSRMQAAGGMPLPPPPPPKDDAGFTKDELQSQLEEIGSTDSKASSLINSVVNNFEAADTDSDGKVSFKEAMAYQEKTASGTSSSSNANDASSSTSQTDSEAGVLKRIMQLIHAYGSQDSTQSGISSLLSTSA